MAKKRRSSRSSSPPRPVQKTYYVRSETRGAPVTASARPDPGPALTFPIFISPRSGRVLSEIEDRRYWSPEPYTRPAASLRQPRHRLQIAMGAQRPTIASAKRGYAIVPDYRPALPVNLRFRGAQSVLVCIRRNQRREALFARGKAGKRAPRRRPKWSSYSKISCRR